VGGLLTTRPESPASSTTDTHRHTPHIDTHAPSSHTHTDQYLDMIVGLDHMTSVLSPALLWSHRPSFCPAPRVSKTGTVGHVSAPKAPGGSSTVSVSLLSKSHSHLHTGQNECPVPLAGDLHMGWSIGLSIFCDMDSSYLLVAGGFLVPTARGTDSMLPKNLTGGGPLHSSRFLSNAACPPGSPTPILRPPSLPRDSKNPATTVTLITGSSCLVLRAAAFLGTLEAEHLQLFSCT
jgi:hypothetical protein